ncbi:MAG TPA: DNA topoisomerase IB [Rudaea sp.]|jgi:DNA topoisomerase-1
MIPSTWTGPGNGAQADGLSGSGLVYVTDREPGFRRERRRSQFVYIGARGRLRDGRILQRIRRLAIPPAYTDVWICRRANGHLQATGRDARGRKQYRYHPLWRATRDATKYGRMLAFVERLPELRRRVAADLRLPGLPRQKVLALLVRLLETSLIRVGNDEYARSNQSYGLTTLKNRHARVRRESIRFSFRGKSGQFHDIRLDDARLARIVRRCQDLPGQDLFQYIGADGRPESIGSADVNAYIRELAGDDFSAKDFRTWAGTLEMARALLELEAPQSEMQAKANIVAATRQVAARLGNTPTVCRTCYVHPAVMDAYQRGALELPRRTLARLHLSAQERALQRLLRRAEAGSAA